MYTSRWPNEAQLCHAGRWASVKSSECSWALSYCAAGGGYVIVTRHTSLKSTGWVRSRNCANTRGCSRKETTHAPSSRRLLNNWSWVMPPRCVGASAAAALSAITLHIGHFTRPMRVVMTNFVKIRQTAHTYEAKNFQIAHQNFMKKRVFKFVTFPTAHSGPRQKTFTWVHNYIPSAIQKHKKLH